MPRTKVRRRPRGGSHAKTPTNLSLRSDLVERARALQLNISHVVEGALEAAIRDVERATWLTENAAAIDEYNAALDIDPGSQTAKENIVLAHNNWGIFLFHHNKYDEAKAEWDKALQMNPLDRNAKQNLAVLKQTLSRLAPPKPPAEKAKGDEGGKESAGKPGVSGVGSKRFGIGYDDTAREKCGQRAKP